MVFQILRLMLKSRRLKEKLIRQNKSKLGRIIVVTGARQTGKTTLVKKTFPRYTYISLDDPVMRMQYKELTASQWAEFYPYAILDEVQKEPVLIESIKAVYDQYEEPKYLLLGSSQLLLLKKVRESLAGRCLINDLYPLTIPELLTESWEDNIEDSFLQKYYKSEFKESPDLKPSFKLEKDYLKKTNAYEYYLRFGGYPALLNGLNDEEKYLWLENYIRTYLERDVRDLANFKSLDSFIKIQKVSALLTGQLVNYTMLGNEAQVTSQTAKRFLEYLKISYQIILLQPWFRNKLKRLVKTPKLHYIDPGVQSAILQKRGYMTGYEFESAIVAEIFKQLKNIDFKGDFYHITTYEGREVDLLLEVESGYIAVEIKMTSNVTKRDAKHLTGLEEILDKPLIKSFILSNDDKVKYFDDNIVAMHAGMFLS